MSLAGAIALCLLAAYEPQSTAVATDARRGAPVLVHAVVENGQERPVADLGSRDVDVLVDGQPATDVSVTCGEPPLTLVVLIDVTASMEDQWRATTGTMRKAVERMLATLHAGDRVRIGAVAATPALGPAFTADSAQMAADARQVLDRKDGERSGPSPIWDALDLAVTALAPEPGRRGVILLTDGRGSGNRLGYTEMAGHAVAAGVAINIVSPFEPTVIAQSATVLTRVRPQTPLGHLADVTGGVLVTSVPEWRQHADSMLLTVLPRIRASCAVSFTPPVADGALHRLEVKISRAGAVTHAPQVMLAPK